MSKTIFNHDRFNIWDKCQRQYYYKYVKMINIPDVNTNFTLGKSVHKLIEYYLKGQEINHLLKNADNEVIDMWEIIKSSELLKKDLIVTEWQFWTPLTNSGLWLGGRIDAIFKDNNNKIYIIDWKTGQKIPTEEANYQAIIYLYSFYKAQSSFNLNFAAEDLIFKFIRFDEEIETKEIEYSQEKQNQYENLLIEKITDIRQATNYSKNEKKHCAYCNYKTFCKKN